MLFPLSTLNIEINKICFKITNLTTKYALRPDRRVSTGAVIINKQITFKIEKLHLFLFPSNTLPQIKLNICEWHFSGMRVFKGPLTVNPTWTTLIYFRQELGAFPPVVMSFKNNERSFPFIWCGGPLLCVAGETFWKLHVLYKILSSVRSRIVLKGLSMSLTTNFSRNFK